MRTSLPLTSTGANGLPVPTSARPSVQRNRSAGAASDCEVGFDSGKITGCGVWRAISRTISSVNAPGCALTPASTVMPRIAHHIAAAKYARCALAPKASIRRRPRACAQRVAARGESLAAFHQQAKTVEGVNAPARLLFAQPFFFHCGDKQIENANAGRTRAKHGDGLLAERNARGIHRRKQRGGGHGRGSLNVVIESAQPVAIALQQPRRVRAGEILPLQKNVRPAALARR